MPESCSWDESVDSVEAMVLAAGQYVGASDDLRPRVLEAIRLQCGEHSARRCLRHAALTLVFLALFTVEIGRELDERGSQFNGAIEAASIDVLNSLIPVATTRNGDGDWRLIDAFTRLRRQQAQLLRFEI